LGPNSHRDDFAIAFDKETASIRIRDFLDRSITDDEIRKLYLIKDNRDWKLSQARMMVKVDDCPVTCLYRPFDYRWMLYGDYAFDYPRPQINNQLIDENNIALITTRQTKEHFGVFVSKVPLGQHKIVTPYDGSYIAPLFSFLDTNGSLETESKISNYRIDIVEKVNSRIGKDVEAMELFDYIYGMLNSPIYINRYKEFLKLDFPRVPYPKNIDEFNQISEIGKKLRELHTMVNSSTWIVEIGYPIVGSNLVEKVEFKDLRVYINETQYFDNIQESMFNYYIGGYQPAQKWLKDRKGRKLSFEDIRHYQEIIYSLSETSKIISQFYEK
jgi:predicted helicase